jgi:hypothetical protein
MILLLLTKILCSIRSLENDFLLNFIFPQAQGWFTSNGMIKRPHFHSHFSTMRCKEGLHQWNDENGIHCWQFIMLTWKILLSHHHQPKSIWKHDYLEVGHGHANEERIILSSPLTWKYIKFGFPSQNCCYNLTLDHTFLIYDHLNLAISGLL